MRRSPDIRVASLDDLETIRELADRTWRHCYPGIISEAQIDYMLGWMYSPETITAEMVGGSICYLLAEATVPERSHPSPIGFAAYGPSDSEPDTTAFLHKLYVAPEHQSQGIGSALLRHIERALRADGTCSLELRVNRENQNAVRAYEKNGFFRVAEICDEIGGGFVMDDYLMRKDLAPNSPVPAES